MSSPCPRHPSHPLVGVCASCLRERLATFVDSEEEEEEEEELGDGRSPPVNKTIANGSYMQDSPTKMGTLVPANELQAAAIETNTSPQGGFSKVTRGPSFNAKLSPISSIKKRTLSYYFDLPNEGVSSTCTTHNSHSNRVDHSSPYKASHDRHGEIKHSSSSFRGHRSPWLDVDQRGTPLSWLSAPFSSRREKQKEKSKQAFAHNPAIAPQVGFDQRIGHGFPVETKQSPVWIKALLSNKWATKLKSGLIKKKLQARLDSDDDKASTMSASSSSAREFIQHHHRQDHYTVQNQSRRQQNLQSKTNQDGDHHSQGEFGSSRRDYGAWDSYCSPVQSTRIDDLKVRQHNKLKSAQRGEGGDMSKHNGLLRFYLTPARGISFLGKSKQRGHQH